MSILGNINSILNNIDEENENNSSNNVYTTPAVIKDDKN